MPPCRWSLSALLMMSACGARSALVPADESRRTDAGVTSNAGSSGAFGGGGQTTGGTGGTGAIAGAGNGTTGGSADTGGSGGVETGGRAGGGAAGTAGTPSACVDNTACDDGNPCTTSDHCVNGECRGTAVSCTIPPLPTCVSDQTLRRYTRPGTCSEGACSYDFTDSTCLAGCKDGACVPFPVSISAGTESTCATVNGGPLKCWGDNTYGQLGIDVATPYSLPVDVPGLTSGVRQVCVGTEDACALTDAGTVQCWGGDYHHIVDITGLSPGITAIACASPYFDHVCAITSQGGLQCWGANQFGQLGDGATLPPFTYQYSITDVVGLSSGIVGVTAGANDTCALGAAGRLWCWGMDQAGQLGDGTQNSTSVPVDVVGLSSGVRSVSAGELTTCAVTSSGGVQCWGSTDGVDHLTPTDVDGLSSGVRAVSVNQPACALTDAGAVKCWGSILGGSLGDGMTTESLVPIDVVGLQTGVVAIASGEYHLCAVMETGGIKCWGLNYNEQLGVPKASGTVPVDVIGF